MKYKLSVSLDHLKSMVQRIEEDATGIGGGMYNRKTYGRTTYHYCSCGWNGSKADKHFDDDKHIFCPQCGGKLLKLGHIPNVISFQRKDNTIFIDEYTVSSEITGNIMDIVEFCTKTGEFEKSSIRDANGKKKTLLKCISAPIYSRRYDEDTFRGFNGILDWCGEDVKETWNMMNYCGGPCDPFLLYSYFPYVFTKENIQRYPKIIISLMFTVFSLISWSQRNGYSRNVFVPERGGKTVYFDSSITMEEMLELCGIPFELINKKSDDIHDVCFLISPEKLRLWYSTPLGKKIIAKHLHGSINLETMFNLAIVSIAFADVARNDFFVNPHSIVVTNCDYMDNYNYNARCVHSFDKVSLSQSEKDCWSAFLCDAIDQYSDFGKLYLEFISRISVLRKFGVLATDDSIKTRAFYGLKNARKGPFVINKGEISFSDIEKSPLEVMSNIKFNPNYLS